MERVQDIGAEIRALIAQLVPQAIEIVSVEFEPGRALHVGYIDGKGRHEVVTWSPVSWETLD